MPSSAATRVPCWLFASTATVGTFSPAARTEPSACGTPTRRRSSRRTAATRTRFATSPPPRTTAGASPNPARCPRRETNRCRVANRIPEGLARTPDLGTRPPPPHFLSQGRDVRRRQAGVLVGRHHGSEDPSLPRPRVGGQRRPLRRRRFAVRERRLRSRRARSTFDPTPATRSRPSPRSATPPRHSPCPTPASSPEASTAPFEPSTFAPDARTSTTPDDRVVSVAISGDGACVLAGLLGCASLCWTRRTATSSRSTAADTWRRRRAWTRD